ncbi:hypothetical protein P4O66_009175, partial [Electrophorus voltai]
MGIRRRVSCATVIPCDIEVILIAMVCLGCTMELSKIKAHILKPKWVLMTVVAQSGVMPLLAFSLAKLLQLSPAEAVTVLACGCCPGGYLSNILTLGVKGDVNLSLVMTTFSTILAMGLMPLLLYLYSQGFSDVSIAVPYTGIIVALAMTTLPCAAGFGMRHYAPQQAKLVSKVRSRVVHLNQERTSRRTVAMETGCQNLQLCLTILMMSFPAEFIGLLYHFPIVYLAFQLSEALVFMKSPKETA